MKSIGINQQSAALALRSPESNYPTIHANMELMEAIGLERTEIGQEIEIKLKVKVSQCGYEQSKNYKNFYATFEVIAAGKAD